MAHFYGQLQGARGQASRLGHKSSGITAKAASYAGAIVVSLSYDAVSGKDIAHVSLAPHLGQGVHKEIWTGAVDGTPAKRAPKKESV